MIPYFDDLTVGQVFDAAPAMTITSGAAAVHQSILGDRMRLPLDATLSHAVTGIRHDPCMLDTFIAVTRFMAGDAARPWWAYTAERKARLAAAAADNKD